MIYLPNECYCSELKVFPKNWQSLKASLKKDWYIFYRFYDPAFKSDSRFKKGKLVRLKGMNVFKSLIDRQAETKRLLHSELDKLKENGFHPIKGLFPSDDIPFTIVPSTPFLKALEETTKRVNGSKSTARDLRSILNFVKTAASQIGLAEKPIGTVSRKHIKMLLTQVEANQQTESAHRYNKIRTYLMILFKELVELEAVDTNPVREISKRQRLQPIRKLLSVEERTRIDKHLKENHYSFWLFTHIFFHSGARLTEMMQLQTKDVDLEKQTFIVTIKKGKQYKQVVKAIKNIALPFWKTVLQKAGSDDYVFSTGLLPGGKRINTDQITKRWNRHVKKKLAIDCDFYSLKHLNLDETAALLSLSDAAAMASHTSTAITIKHYAVREKERQNERLKKINNSFS